MITISENAAKKIKALIGGQAGKVLRMKVVGGGCSGLQYKLDIDESRPGDRSFERDGVAVVTDRKSYLYLHGTELDYAVGDSFGIFPANDLELVEAVLAAFPPLPFDLIAARAHARRPARCRDRCGRSCRR